MTGRFSPRALWEEERAISIGIVRFFLSVFGIGSIMTFLVWEITAPILDRADTEGAGTAAAEGTTWLNQGLDYLPVIFLLVGGFGLVAYAVFQRQVVR